MVGEVTLAEPWPMKEGRGKLSSMVGTDEEALVGGECLYLRLLILRYVYLSTFS